MEHIARLVSIFMFMKRISIKLKFPDSPNKVSVPTVSVKEFEETLWNITEHCLWGM